MISILMMCQETCEALQSYLNDTLGRYVVNVTEAAFLCSRMLCSSQGRCVRRDPSAEVYLHLDPSVWSIIPRLPVSSGPSFVAYRRMRTVQRETSFSTAQFKCQCFPGWQGERCQKPASST